MGLLELASDLTSAFERFGKILQRVIECTGLEPQLPDIDEGLGSTGLIAKFPELGQCLLMQLNGFAIAQGGYIGESR